MQSFSQTDTTKTSYPRVYIPNQLVKDTIVGFRPQMVKQILKDLVELDYLRSKNVIDSNVNVSLNKMLDTKNQFIFNQNQIILSKDKIIGAKDLEVSHLEIDLKNSQKEVKQQKLITGVTVGGFCVVFAGVIAIIALGK